MMKKIICKIAAVALLLGVSTAAQAQTVEDNYPYNFISVQGGVQGTMTNYDFTKLLTPQFALSAGRYFNSKVGTRLHLQGWQVKGAISDTYTFNAITGDIDLLMNLTNILNPNRVSDKLDWVLLAGFGVNYGWDFDEFNTMNNALATDPNPYPCGSKHSTFNSRIGTQVNFNLSDNLALGLEVDANMKNDEFNLKRNYDPDFQLVGLLGLTYKFGKCKPAPEPEPIPVVEEPAPEPVVVEEPKPEPKAVVKKETLHEEIFYLICKSEPTVSGTNQMKRVADFMNKYKDAKVQIVGYADRGTGNPKINVMYAERRAAQCKDALVNIYGCDAARILIDSKGDTVQPFPENDKNRCVIIDSEAQYTVYE